MGDKRWDFVQVGTNKLGKVTQQQTSTNTPRDTPSPKPTRRNSANKWQWKQVNLNEDVPSTIADHQSEPKDSLKSFQYFDFVSINAKDIAKSENSSNQRRGSQSNPAIKADNITMPNARRNSISPSLLASTTGGTPDVTFVQHPVNFHPAHRRPSLPIINEPQKRSPTLARSPSASSLFKEWHKSSTDTLEDSIAGSLPSTYLRTEYCSASFSADHQHHNSM